MTDLCSTLPRNDDKLSRDGHQPVRWGSCYVCGHHLKRSTWLQRMPDTVTSASSQHLYMSSYLFRPPLLHYHTENRLSIPTQHLPHIAAAMTMGINSLIAILIPAGHDVMDHGNCQSQYAPHPQLPDASEVKTALGSCSRRTDNDNTPFPSVKNSLSNPTGPLY